MARILVTGVSGLLGINLAQEMMTEHDIVGVDRGKLVNAPFKILKADLLDAGAVDSVLDSAQPEWLINCAALADLDACEADPDLACRLNTDLPAQMAKACKAARHFVCCTFQLMLSSMAKKMVFILKRMSPIRLEFMPKQNWRVSVP